MSTRRIYDKNVQKITCAELQYRDVAEYGSTVSMHATTRLYVRTGRELKTQLLHSYHGTALFRRTLTGSVLAVLWSPSPALSLGRRAVRDGHSRRAASWRPRGWAAVGSLPRARARALACRAGRRHGRRVGRRVGRRIGRGRCRRVGAGCRWSLGTRSQRAR